MGSYNIITAAMQCPRCGAPGEFEITLRLGYGCLLEYKIGDVYEWRPRKAIQNGGRPESGNIDGDGYTECPACGKDSFVIVKIREDVIQSVRPNSEKAPYME